jgi:hypothetical protein
VVVVVAVLVVSDDIIRSSSRSSTGRRGQGAKARIAPSDGDAKRRSDRSRRRRPRRKAQPREPSRRGSPAAGGDDNAPERHELIDYSLVSFYERKLAKREAYGSDRCGWPPLLPTSVVVAAAVAVLVRQITKT